MLQIHEIRELLNEQTFRDGCREVSLGAAAEFFDGVDEEQLPAAIADLESRLSDNDLALRREEPESHELFVVQRLRHREVDTRWIALAWGWAARIMGLAIAMTLPIVGGMWLADRTGVTWLGLVGVAIGLALGLSFLVLLARRGKDALR